MVYFEIKVTNALGNLRARNFLSVAVIMTLVQHL